MKGNFNEIINSDKPVLVDFYADWCQPCKVQSPAVSEIAHEYSGRIRVIKIDVDKNPGVSMQYNVQSIPTLILFENGKIKWRQAGVTPKKSIKSVIQNIIH